jgi:hypothetical protein
MKNNILKFSTEPQIKKSEKYYNLNKLKLSVEAHRAVRRRGLYVLDSLLIDGGEVFSHKHHTHFC